MNDRIQLECDRSCDPMAARKLLELFHRHSEDIWFAGWMNGLDIALWDLVTGASKSWGVDSFSESEISELRDLSCVCQGWWTFKETQGEKFLTLEEWKARISA